MVASFGSFVVGAAAALALVAYLGYKFHSASAALAAVKAELAKIEGEIKVPELYGEVAVAKVAIVNRLKALL